MADLYIDTRNSEKIVVCVVDKGKKDCLEEVANKLRAQMTLPLIKKLLKKNKIDLSAITNINIETGPGSFTGLRVGMSIANALSLGARIKVNGKELGNLEKVTY